MTGDKKIKIHIKNNHWAPGSFPTDLEGEKNFTITEEHLNEASFKCSSVIVKFFSPSRSVGNEPGAQ